MICDNRIKGLVKKDPLISIITVTFNSIDKIEQTILNIINAIGHDVEYILIDGGSDDGSLNIIKKYNDLIDLWISEPDLGIYDAMNKGIKYSKGKYILNINCGDYILHLPKKELLNAYKDKIDIVCFSVLSNNNLIIKPNLGFPLKIHNTIPHQGIFYSNKLDFIYNTKYSVFADFDLNQRIKLSKCTYRIHKNIVSNHMEDGVSNVNIYFRENYEIIRKNYGFFYIILSYLYFKLRGIKNRLIR